jgi:hypothetical protein
MFDSSVCGVRICEYAGSRSSGAAATAGTVSPWMLGT